MIKHEIGHLLGLPHEHQRPQRDQHIQVYWPNISPEGIDNYIVLDESDFPENYPHWTAYDLSSIMHYCNDFGIDKTQPTFLIIDDYKAIRGTGCNTHISEQDAWKVNYMYGLYP